MFDPTVGCPEDVHATLGGSGRGGSTPPEQAEAGDREETRLAGGWQEGLVARFASIWFGFMGGSAKLLKRHLENRSSHWFTCIL